MDEHKENIHAKDVNVKMSNTKEDEKVGGRSAEASFIFGDNVDCLYLSYDQINKFNWNVKSNTSYHENVLLPSRYILISSKVHDKCNTTVYHGIIMHDC